MKTQARFKMTNHKTTGELFNEEYKSQKQGIIQKFKSESIKEHKWVSDSNACESNINVIECHDSFITLSIGNPDESFSSTIYKDDAIAIAKHFNLLITEMPLNETVEQFDEFMRGVK